MKKQLMFVLLAILFIGCNKSDKVTRSHYIDDKVGTIYKFEFEGHTYLIRNRLADSGGWGGMCHDENCRCKNDSINE